MQIFDNKTRQQSGIPDSFLVFGAIVQVIWEMRGLLKLDASVFLTYRTAAFVVALVLFTLEEIIVNTLFSGERTVPPSNPQRLCAVAQNRSV